MLVVAATAETSSWNSQVQLPSTAKPAASPKPKAFAKPQASPAPKAPAPKGDLMSETAPTPLTPGPQRRGGFQLAPVTGEDAAQIAFNQGQFLTALGLAEVAAGRGDAAAHTMVGRIYAEGLGVARDMIVAARW